VRPSFVVMRTVILVEGAPKGTEAEVRKFIASGPCGEPTASGVEPDGSFAFAFGTEDVANQAIEFVNDNKFRKTVVLAGRTKLDTSFKAQPGGTGMGFGGPMPAIDPAFAAAAAANPYLAYYMGYGAYMNPYAMGAPVGDFPNAFPPGAVPAQPAGDRGMQGTDAFRGGRGGQFPQQGVAGARRGGRGNGRENAVYTNPHAQRGGPAGRAGRAEGKGPLPKNSARGGAAPKAAGRGNDARNTKPEVNFTPTDFPALPATGGGKGSGYAKQFSKYEKESIVSILKGLEAQEPKKLVSDVEAVEDIITGSQAAQLLTPFPKSAPRQKTAADVAKATVQAPPAGGPTPAEEAAAPAAARAAPAPERPAASGADGGSTAAPASRPSEKAASSGPTWASIAQKKDEST
jgi:hypothetical protein